MSKWYRSILMVLGLSASTATAATLDEAQFSQAFVVKVQEIDSTAKAQVTGYLQVQVKLPDEKNSTAYLDNAYRLYQKSPGDLQSLLKEYAQHAIGLAEGSNENASGVILPVIRAFESFTSVSPEILSDGPKGLEYIPLTIDTGIFFVRDGDQSVSYLSHADFAKLGVPKKELFEGSLDTLNSGSHETNVASSVFMAVVVGDMYASSLVLTNGYWQKFPLNFKGDLVVFLIARDTFIVTGTEEEKGMEAAKQLATKWMTDAAYPISDAPLVRLHGSWQALK
jgi:uncharacterized protein YtpQ (UPF0354 family)